MSAQPQHLQALALANKARFARATLRTWVKEPADAVVSRHRLADLIDPETGLKACLRNLPLEEFLLWGYKLYPSTRQGCYELADAGAYRTLGALTERQRRVIAGALRMAAPQLQEARRVHEFNQRQIRKAAA